MYTFLTYPFDIIKTNRILQTSLSKEGAESIPKEFTALYEKGGLSRGLFRGMVAGYIAANMQVALTDPVNGTFGAAVMTVLCNPLSILQVHKQAFHNSVTKSYSEIFSEIGALRMFTLGLIPSMGRNVLLCAGFVPSFLG